MNKPRKNKPLIVRSDNSDSVGELKFKFVDSTSVHDPVKLLDFIEWNAAPRDLKKIKTQGQFAKSFGLHIDTLTDWKKLDGFWDEVKSKRDQSFRSHSTEIIHALAKRAMSGNSKAVELWLKLFEGYDEHIKVTNLPQESALTEERKAEIAKAMSNWSRARNNLHNRSFTNKQSGTN